MVRKRLGQGARCQSVFKNDEGLPSTLSTFKLLGCRSVGPSLWPSEIEDLNALLEILVHDGTDLFPHAKYHQLLGKIFQQSEDTGSTLNARELSRRVSSAAVMTSVALRNASLASNHYAIVVAWVMFTSYAVAAAEKHGIPFDRPAGLSVDFAKEAARSELAAMCDEIAEHPQLPSKSPLDIMEVRRARATLIVGLMSLYWMWSEKVGWIVPTHRDFLLSWLPSDHRRSYLWGEGAVPSLLSHFFYLSNTDATSNPEDLLFKLNEAVKWTPDLGQGA